MRPEILFPLFAEATTLKGVGAKVEPLVRKVAGPLVRDVLFTAPHGVIDRGRTTIALAQDGAVQTFVVTVDRHLPAAKIGAPYKIRAFDDTGFLHLVYFRVYGDTLGRTAPPGAKIAVSGRVERFNNEVQIPHPDYLVAAARLDEIPPVEPVYPATAGLTSRTFRRVAQQAVERALDLPEWQDPAWLAQQGWPGWKAAVEALHAPGTPGDVEADAPARARLAYDEFLAHQLALAVRGRERRAHEAPMIAPGPVSTAVEAALPFALTGAQGRALAEIRADLASGRRMGRLLQGDVGSGKTAVALLALADVAGAGRQGALMA
ncbi:MAG TPA: ATP-dependent DNA helicase RecG, partial [Caulobacteraceae bacterium]